MKTVENETFKTQFDKFYQGLDSMQKTYFRANVIKHLRIDQVKFQNVRTRGSSFAPIEKDLILEIARDTIANSDLQFADVFGNDK